MKRSVTIGLVTALALLAPALWLGAGWLLGPGPGGDGAVAPAPGEPGPRRQGEARAHVGADGLVSRSDGDPSGSRQSLGSRVGFQVVERSSGRPLPEATVRAYVPPDPDSRGESTAWDLETIDTWMATRGLPLAVQPDGSAWLALPPGGTAVVVGQAPGLWGRALVQAEAEQPQRLELAADSSLEVRAVDPLGAPRAGIPVALRLSRDGWAQDRLTLPTGEDGRVVLPHVGVLLGEAPGGATWSVAAVVLLGQPVEQRLEPAAPPHAPIVLVVPATGVVEVSVRAPPGGPSPEGGEVGLVHVQEGVAARPGFWGRPRRVARPLRDGRARFEHVGLGLELGVEARGPDSVQPTRLVTRGPARADEVREVELVLAADHPLLRLRLVDGQGQPLAGTGVRAELVQETVFSSTASRAELRTDARGVLFYDLAAEWVEGGERRLVLTTTASADTAAGRAELDLARRFAPGLDDLGDVVVVAGERLAAGRVEDSSGAAVAGARVAVQLSKDWAGDTPWFERRPELDATTDARGAFEVRGPVESTELRLVASAQGFGAEPLVVPAGATDVVLRLGRAGSVEGRVLVDEGVALDQLAVQLHPALGHPGERGERRGVASIEAEGAFALRGLYPGPYDLVVRVRESGEELASIEGLVVPGGAPSPDPRLAAIDLRGRLCSFTLTLVPPRAGMSVSGVVVVRPVEADPGVLAGQRTRFFLGEQLPFTAVAPALDLEVLAQGFRRVRLESVRADTRVELQEGPAVRLRLPRDVELPQPPRYLKAFVGSEQDFWTLGHMQDAVFGPSRELALRVAQPGRLQVLWMLEERNEGTISTTTLGYEEPQTIEVLDLPGEQVFDAAPDPGAYADALERRRGR